jgi:hypothetical protein
MDGSVARRLRMQVTTIHKNIVCAQKRGQYIRASSGIRTLNRMKSYLEPCLRAAKTHAFDRAATVVTALMSETN